MRVTVVGGLTIDISSDGRTIIGGPPWYAGTASHALKTKVSIFSAVGDDFPPHFLQMLEKAGLETSHVLKIPSHRTYSFKPVFIDGRRSLKLVSKGPEIPLMLLNEIDADAVIISPVFKEVDERHVQTARSRAGLMAVDLQGFVRNVDSQNNIFLTPFKAVKMLKLIDVVHCSEEEAVSLTSRSNIVEAASSLMKYGVRVCLIGLDDGLILLDDNTLTLIDVEGYEPVKDTTGAGDILTGVFTSLVLMGHSPEEAALKALEAVALSLRNEPPNRVPETLVITGHTSRVVWRRVVR